MQSKDKVAVVTGAGSGVGKSAVMHLLKDGYSVALAGRRKELLNETIEESGVSKNKVISVSTDVGDANSVKNLFSLVLENFGRLDVLFNNAGIGSPRMPMEEISLDDATKFLQWWFSTGLYLQKKVTFFFSISFKFLINSQ